MFNNDYLGSWQEILKNETEKDYFQILLKNVQQEFNDGTCYPADNLIFAAFEKCDYKNLKVVIIGQDPYHGAGEANGLCFSVNNDVKIPPSLKNIFKEINTDLGRILMPTSGNLQHWADQGVFLLNNSLTVRKDQANSHKHLGWSIFTDSVIEIISEKKENIVFLLWGNFAQRIGSKIDRCKHFVLESGHPSPMSANQKKWFGNKHFSQTNSFLKSKNITQIDW